MLKFESFDQSRISTNPSIEVTKSVRESNGSQNKKIFNVKSVQNVLKKLPKFQLKKSLQKLSKVTVSGLRRAFYGKLYFQKWFKTKKDKRKNCRTVHNRKTSFHCSSTLC